MKSEFKTGDVVTLNSGGHAMTVKEVIKEEGAEDKICCVWSNNNKILEYTFDTSLLCEDSEACGYEEMLRRVREVENNPGYMVDIDPEIDEVDE